ncbi:phosphonate ABC transporter permease [Bhargavaea cecembensis]|uniref:Phosphonate ABC transporter permease n=1 Tax=Bhargavaea cecembensis TaxID=394098 RepID=A0A161RI98_9BACL|nr:phosphonate ABC transporter, permease protein PhnE [Bhargavaea cecembensis]KZE37828.1 phosphonate ABC transporter permease [Bhargavaea cecembensis]
MDRHTPSIKAEMPARFRRPSILSFFGWILFIAFISMGINGADMTPDRLFNGILNIGSFVGNAFPPDFSRIGPIVLSMIETLEMALVGTTFGVLLSLPVALLAAKNTSPHPAIRSAVKGIIMVLRTIPDLVFALIFVIAIGLGPLAGILTITVDTIGFCGRFFAERIEELDKGPVQALESTGASQFGIISGSVIPMAFPSFVGTSLFAVEKSIRGAAVLGLVGAGGIGVQLNTAMSLRNFDEALMIILVILAVVLIVERISASIRKKVL